MTDGTSLAVRAEAAGMDAQANVMSTPQSGRTRRAGLGIRKS
jgi:hypothetical protein